MFRKADNAPPVADQAVTLKQKYGKPDVFWILLRIVNKSLRKQREKQA